MTTKPKYYIVEASALPEVFLKVAEAKRLLSTGEASTVNEATKMTDISRSAFYKYRDAVLPFQNMMTGRIITLQLLLRDEVGLLSELLDVFADTNVNNPQKEIRQYHKDSQREGNQHGRNQGYRQVTNGKNGTPLDQFPGGIVELCQDCKQIQGNQQQCDQQKNRNEDQNLSNGRRNIHDTG